MIFLLTAGWARLGKVKMPSSSNEFNLKLKIHEYEKRLKLVDLHGHTGKVLQEENLRFTMN